MEVILSHQMVVRVGAITIATAATAVGVDVIHLHSLLIITSITPWGMEDVDRHDDGLSSRSETRKTVGCWRFLRV